MEVDGKMVFFNKAEAKEEAEKEGFKQLPDEVYRRYGFTPAKVEVEEHYVKVYAGKETDEIVRAPHPECLLKGSLVSPSLEAAVMNAKYVNAVPLYRQEQEFERYGRHISRQNMANWTMQCADRYLAVLNDHLHEKMYGYHVLQADETPAGGGLFRMDKGKYPESPTEKQNMGGLPLFHQSVKIPEGVS